MVMFSVKKKIKTSSDQKIDQIIAILYPPLKLEEEDGIKFHIDYGADSNLDAALTDLEDGHNDPIARKTIKEVSDRLLKVRRLLEAYSQLDKDAQYVIVDNFAKDEDIQHAE